MQDFTVGRTLAAQCPGSHSDVLARGARLARRRDLQRARRFSTPEKDRDPRRARRARRRGRTGSSRRNSGAPIIKALLGKAAVPDDSPYTTGGIGLLGTTPSQEAMEECDTLLHGRHVFPLHRIPAQTGPGAGRADRYRSGADRLALSGRGRTRRRLPRTL